MRILIDADGCPVVDLAVKIAKEKNIECVILCDTAHFFSIDGVKTITVDQGADSVDFKLVNMLEKNDIVITQDYGLAAMCLAKQGRPMNQNGIIFTNQNIDSFLTTRHINKKAMQSGKRIKGPKKRTEAQNEKFLEALLWLIEN